jgi:biotin-(acetyl-CoA carboxylase) ligase
VSIFRELQARIPSLERAFHELIQEASGRSALLGRPLRLREGTLIIEGVAEALDATGQLLVRETSGVLRRVSTGEVTVLRPKELSGR